VYQVKKKQTQQKGFQPILSNKIDKRAASPEPQPREANLIVKREEKPVIETQKIEEAKASKQEEMNVE